VAAKVSGLAHTELSHSSDPVLDHLPLFSEVIEGRALLPGLGRLDHCLLRMQQHLAPLPGWPVAACSERTSRAANSRKRKRQVLHRLATLAGVKPFAHEVVGDLSGGALTGHSVGVNVEAVLAEEADVGSLWRLGLQLDTGLSEALAVLTAAVCHVAEDCFGLEPRGGLALLHQLEAAGLVLGAAGEDVNSGDELAVDVGDQRHLVSVEADRLALTPMAHLGVVHRDDAFSAGSLADLLRPTAAVASVLHILQEDLTEDLGGVEQALVGRAARDQAGAHLAGHLKDASSVVDEHSQKGLLLRLRWSAVSCSVCSSTPRTSRMARSWLTRRVRTA
jgi:hypothetical protein